MESNYPADNSPEISCQKKISPLEVIHGKNCQVFVSVQKVLQNDLIFSIILNHLNFEEVKQCRLVCWRWKNVAERKFGKLAKIILTPSELQSFAERDVEINGFITDMKIIGLPEQEVTITRDSNIDLASFIPQHITNLCVDTKCVACLHLDGLVSLKSLTVVHPVDLVFNGNKISPEKLELLGQTFFVVDGKKDEDGLINNYVDFHKMEMLELPSSVTLDMGENLCVDTIALKRTKIINGETANWTVRIASLYGFCFRQRTEMNIKNLILFCGSVDLSCLPPTVERLILVRDTKVTRTDLVHLPKLKCLQLCNIPKCFEIGWVPPSVTKMHVYGNYFTGKGEFHVDALILERSAISEVEQIFKMVKPKHLRIMFTRDLDAPFFEQNQAFADFIKNSQIPTITVLGCLWLNDNFHASPLSKMVDRQAWSYQFKSGKGTAMKFESYPLYMSPLPTRGSQTLPAA